MPTKHLGVGAAAAVVKVGSNGGRGGTRVRVEREEIAGGGLSSNSKQDSARTQVRPGEAQVVGVCSYRNPHLMSQLTFRVTVGLEPEVSQGALGREQRHGQPYCGTSSVFASTMR